MLNSDTTDDDEVAACIAAVAQYLGEKQAPPKTGQCQLSAWHQAALLESAGYAQDICDISRLQAESEIWRNSVRYWPMLMALVALLGLWSKPAIAQGTGYQTSAASVSQSSQMAPPVLSRPPLAQIAARSVECEQQTQPPRDPSALQPQAVPPPGAGEPPIAPQAVANDLPAAPAVAKPVTLRVLLQSDSSSVSVRVPSGATLKDVITDDTLAELPPQSQWHIAVRPARGTLQLSFSGMLADALHPLLLASGSEYRRVAFSGTANTTPNMVPVPANVPQHFWLPALHRSPAPAEQFRPYLIVPEDSQAVIELSGKPYRGMLLVHANARGALDIVNCVDLESYLKSVVSCEMPSAWPLEALKAQAIAARSYAVASMGKHEADGYDLKADIEDQVYKGASTETPASLSAVEQTQGQVLCYQGKVINAYFHSGGGGCTEIAENVWGRSVPYLRSVADYDDDSPYFCWSRQMSTDQVEQLLAASGKNVGSLLALMPIERGISPRVRWLLASGTERSLFLTGEQIRKIFGLPSACFNVVCGDNSYTFAGRGFGHGLGMSQWGAKKLAEAGMQASDILKYYFKDVTATQL